MRKAFTSIAILMVVSFAYADHVEFDLDDIQGNGPDVIHAEVSDYVLVDVWFFNDIPMMYFGVTVNQLNGALEYQSCEYFTPGWTAVAPVPGPVFTVQATTWCSNPIVGPALVATVTFRAVSDCLIADIQGTDAGYMGNDYVTYYIDAINARVIIGGIATESTSWGGVKGLFR